VLAGAQFRLMTLTLTQILAIRCPTCGAAPGVKCELSTGQPRFEPHQARRLKASDTIDGKSRYAGENERSFQKLMARLNGNRKPQRKQKDAE
jgi:hypothetical protein